MAGGLPSVRAAVAIPGSPSPLEKIRCGDGHVPRLPSDLVFGYRNGKTMLDPPKGATMTTDSNIVRAIVWTTAYNRVPLLFGIFRGWRRSRAANAVADWRSFSGT